MFFDQGNNQELVMPAGILSNLYNRVVGARMSSRMYHYPTAGLELLANWAVKNFDFQACTEFQKGKNWERYDDLTTGQICLQTKATFWDRTIAEPHHGLFSVTFNKDGFPIEAMAVSNLQDPEKAVHWGKAPDFAVLADMDDFNQLNTLKTPSVKVTQEMLDIAKEAHSMIELPDHLQMAPVLDWLYSERPSGVIMSREMYLRPRDKDTADFCSNAVLRVEFDAEGNPLGAWLNTERRKPIAMLDAGSLAPKHSGPKM